MFDATDAWKERYRSAHAGLLVMDGVENPPKHPELERLKNDLENTLRTRFAGYDRGAIEKLSTVAAYNAYYRQFRKSYPVQAQLESIVFKGKPIPSVAALVEAMFMAEMKNLLLTAGHDLDRVLPPITLDVGRGNERYISLRGQEQAVKAGDMIMTDGGGVISSVLYGPDHRTQISAMTRRVLFTVYAPAGIESPKVRAHLEDIRDYVLIVSPESTVRALYVPTAGR